VEAARFAQATEALSDTVGQGRAETPEVLQANLLREQAISVLDQRGPADLALAQLTRAALLDPEQAETWQALERGSAQVETAARPAGDRWAQFRSTLAARFRALGAGVVEGATYVRSSIIDVWNTHRTNPRSWAGALFLTLLTGTLTWLALRSRARARLIRAHAQAAAQRAKEAELLTGGANPATTPSADELALRAYLAERESHSGGTADTGILARA